MNIISPFNLKFVKKGKFFLVYLEGALHTQIIRPPQKQETPYAYMKHFTITRFIYK